MKKFSFMIIAASFLFAACGESVKNNADTTDTTATTQEAPAAENKVAAAKDPVCGMDKDSTWTEFSVAGTDTTWFCSPHCKETFDKNPGKYKKM